MKGARAHALAPFGETDLQFAGQIKFTDLLLRQQQPQQQRPFPRQCRGDWRYLTEEEVDRLRMGAFE